MKKILFTVCAFTLALALGSCGGSTGQSGNDVAADSVSQGDTTALAPGAAADAASATGESASEAPGAGQAAADAAQEGADVLNQALLGKWDNYNDPNISMTLSDKMKIYDGHRGYGNLSASNEYFEIDLKLVFTSIEPDGTGIKVGYDKYEAYFDGGDPDDLGAEDGGWVETKVGKGTLTIVPQGNQIKLVSKEPRLNGKLLRK